MHPFVLVFCIIAALIVLPRLANLFRQPEDTAPTLSEQKAKIEPGDRGSLIVATKPVGQGAFPVTVKTAEAPLTSSVSLIPDGEDELIMAIQKELTRLGYYDGPVTKKWNGNVRGAVRKFTGSRRSRPSQGLLIALRAAKPPVPQNVVHLSTRFDLKSAEEQLNGKTPAVTFSPSPKEGVLSDGYLPPWESHWKKGTQTAQGASGELQQNPVHVASRKRERLARAAAAKRARRQRSAFSPSNFSWPGF